MTRHYAIIEIESGLAVAELQPGVSPEEAAQREGGLVADPGPYTSYDDACEAIVALEKEESEEDAV